MGGAASVNVDMGRGGRQRQRPVTPVTRLLQSSRQTLFKQLSVFADENAPPSPYLSPCKRFGKNRYSFKDGAVKIEHLDHLSEREWARERSDSANGCGLYASIGDVGDGGGGGESKAAGAGSAARAAAARSRKRREEERRRADAAADDTDIDVDKASVKQLRRYIAALGSSSEDCLTKADLRQRAREAAEAAVKVAAEAEAEE